MFCRLCFAAVLSASSLAGAADVYVGIDVAESDRVPLAEIDHTAWDELLVRFVDDDGRVDYRGWKSDSAARERLIGYLKTLSTADVTAASSPEAWLAFWINAYNAVTIEGILREYPTSSIRNHTASLWGYNIWKNLKLRVASDTVSLDEMEHKRLRPRGEPRIHFAIVCASNGCPRLLNEAYTQDRIDEQLSRNARHFFAQPANLRIDPSGAVYLSSILNWFGEDFGDNAAAVLLRISEWAPEGARDALLRPGAKVRYLGYDWDLNEQ